MSLENGKRPKYGFGWMLNKEGKTIHSGSWLGARTYIARDTSTKTCIVVLDNSTNDKYLDEIADAVEEAVMD